MGAKVVDRLATHLYAELPGQHGWSGANPLHMRAVARVRSVEYALRPVSIAQRLHNPCPRTEV